MDQNSYSPYFNVIFPSFAQRYGWNLIKGRNASKTESWQKLTKMSTSLTILKILHFWSNMIAPKWSMQQIMFKIQNSFVDQLILRRTPERSLPRMSLSISVSTDLIQNQESSVKIYMVSSYWLYDIYIQGKQITDLRHVTKLLSCIIDESTAL